VAVVRHTAMAAVYMEEYPLLNTDKHVYSFLEYPQFIQTSEGAG